jgi:hypothetical protein
MKHWHAACGPLSALEGSRRVARSLAELLTSYSISKFYSFPRSHHTRKNNHQDIYRLHTERRLPNQVTTSLNRPIRPYTPKACGVSNNSPLQVAPYPIRELLQLLKTEEDQDCGRLQPEPCRDPAFEHEGVTFVCYGCPNSPDRGRRPRT